MEAHQTEAEGVEGEYECVDCKTRWEVSISNVKTTCENWVPTCPVCGTDDSTRSVDETDSEVVNYRRRDAGELSYEIRDALDSYDRVEIWSDEMQLLATADSSTHVFEPEQGRKVRVGRETVSPERVVELTFVNTEDE